jgi:hypothetical protein
MRMCLRQACAALESRLHIAHCALRCSQDGPGHEAMPAPADTDPDTAAMRGSAPFIPVWVSTYILVFLNPVNG